MGSSTGAFTLGAIRTCMRAVDFSSSRSNRRDPCMDFLTTNNLIKDTLMVIHLTPTSLTPTLVGLSGARSQAHHACTAAG